MADFAKIIATFFGSGLAPKAPGTFGTLAAMPLVVALHQMHLQWLLAPLTLLAIVGGVWASARYLQQSGQSGDPKEVVIDEVAGVWLLFALMPLYYLPASYEMAGAMYLMGFVAFRFFDILKPWPICVIDRRMKGAWGIMLDDLAAAVLGVAALGVLGHLWMNFIA